MTQSTRLYLQALQWLRSSCTPAGRHLGKARLLVKGESSDPICCQTNCACNNTSALDHHNRETTAEAWIHHAPLRTKYSGVEKKERKSA
ncbi:hypothetical protein BDL97_14G076300 [Sphagnum fallax]|nr:hypothetical protein BDL97_14G076300 [Sphagnum fallax]